MNSFPPPSLDPPLSPCLHYACLPLPCVTQNRDISFSILPVSLSLSLSLSRMVSAFSAHFPRSRHILIFLQPTLVSFVFSSRSFDLSFLLSFSIFLFYNLIWLLLPASPSLMSVSFHFLPRVSIVSFLLRWLSRERCGYQLNCQNYLGVTRLEMPGQTL